MPKLIKQLKTKKPRGRPKFKNEPDDVNELDKVQDDGNILIQITWGQHWVEM